MQKLTKKELTEIYNLELSELLAMAKKNMSNNMDFCSLISAKTGKCSQNCKYCAQSSHYNTDIATHPLVSVETVKEVAIEAKSNFANRFAIVTSGRETTKEDFQTILEMIKTINEVGLKSCGSLGFLTAETAKKFKEAGLVRYHHNINTCKSYYPDVCTTHTYEERIETINFAKEVGLELCCGVILGMGETVEQRVEMALELAEINPQSVPVNFLCPIENTPFETYLDKIDEEHILRTLALFKVAMPNAVIRFAGGRNLRLSKENQQIALENAVEGLILGNMLTTVGTTEAQDLQTAKDLGRNILV